MKSMMPSGCMSLVVLLALLIVFPIFLADTINVTLARLGLSPQMSLLAVIGIFFGGMINIPVKRMPRSDLIDVIPFDLFGVGKLMPRYVRRRTYTVIAINMGGCIVPCLIAAYELIRIAEHGPVPFSAAITSIGITTSVCYFLARPVPNVGIAMNAFIPALVAAACGLILARDVAPLVAFASGVLGTLIGADLLHLGDIKKITTGVASIGGAGTFDGIVLSGFIATFLV
jgi:uncharacterized membrane protein